MNKVILIGNVVADAETRHTQGGQAVTNFRMATNEKWRDKGGQLQERSEYHVCVMWGQENTAKYITKGKQVMVEGSLRERSWEDKDGKKRYVTEILVDRTELLGGGRGMDRGGSDQARGNRQQEQRPAEDDIPDGPGAVDEDELPFAPVGDVG